MSNRLIHAVAPTRICDVGGWTDTWFSKTGRIFNIAISPGVEVQIRVTEGRVDNRQVVIQAENYQEIYRLDPDTQPPGKHPLIEAALLEMNLPQGCTLEVNIYSEAPPGASMGTSAAVSVALMGALDKLVGGNLPPTEIAAWAHRLETRNLGLECGVQDQIASANGGIQLIEMTEYPHTIPETIQPSQQILWDLERRLLLIYIGKPHQSSEIHQKVIADLGAEPENDSRLQALRDLATEASESLLAGDFNRLGNVFNRNTEIQRELHPDLICADFEKIIEAAQQHQAVGCKVNGAGGDGGSVAILCSPNMVLKRKLERVLTEKGYQSLAIQLSTQGLRVWETEDELLS